MGILTRYARPAGSDRARMTVAISVPTELYQTFQSYCNTLGLGVDEAVQRLMEHELGSAPGAETAPRSRSDRYREFWASLLQELGRQRVPLPQNWFSFPLGVPGITADMVFTKAHQFRICCVMHLEDRMVNERYFQALGTQKPAIEAEWGSALHWEARPGRKACRVCDETPGNIDRVDALPALRAWAIDRLVRAERVFGPRIRDLAEPLSQ